LGPKPRVLPHDSGMVLMLIGPSVYIDVDSLTPIEPSSPEPVKVKEEPQDDGPFPALKDVDTTEAIDLDDFPGSDDVVQTEEMLHTTNDENIVITLRRRRPSRPTKIHSVESDSDETTISAAPKDKSSPERFETDLEEIGDTGTNIKAHNDQASDWDSDGTPEPTKGVNIDDLDDEDISIQMRDADDETRRNIRMYLLIWLQAKLWSRRLAALSGSMYEHKHLRSLWKDEYLPKLRRPYKLKGWQRLGVAFLHEAREKHRKALLGDEMGVGKVSDHYILRLLMLKTLQTYSYIWGRNKQVDTGDHDTQNPKYKRIAHVIVV
jgi:hypothetical protein